MILKLIFSVLESFFTLCFTFCKFHLFSFRLTGYAPFYGDSIEEILAKNKECDIFFEFESIGIKTSSEALDLL